MNQNELHGQEQATATENTVSGGEAGTVIQGHNVTSTDSHGNISTVGQGTIVHGDIHGDINMTFN